MEGSILARRDCLTLDNGMRLRLLTALEVHQARREAEGLARAPKEHALCSNACLLARALETEEGSPIFSGGEAVLAGLRVEEIAALARPGASLTGKKIRPSPWGRRKPRR